MVGRIVELATNGGQVSLDRGFLTISNDNSKGKIPIDDIEAVITSAFGITYTNAALTALAERGAPLVICGNNYAPTAILISLDGHYAQGKRIAAQAAAQKPQNKQLWAQIIRAKISAQHQILQIYGINSSRLERLSKSVKSGDSTHTEGQAAALYFRLMFGDNFRRNTDEKGLNSFLNYGYAILRAATSRAITASGLHPSLSIQHESAGDALRLADDLMEPFRPSIDFVVKSLWGNTSHELNPQTKLELAKCLTMDYKTEIGVTPLSVCLSRLCNSLAKYYLKETNKLEFPNPLIPIMDEEE